MANIRGMDSFRDRSVSRRGGKVNSSAAAVSKELSTIKSELSRPTINPEDLGRTLASKVVVQDDRLQGLEEVFRWMSGQLDQSAKFSPSQQKFGQDELRQLFTTFLEEVSSRIYKGPRGEHISSGQLQKRLDLISPDLGMKKYVVLAVRRSLERDTDESAHGLEQALDSVTCGALSEKEMSMVTSDALALSSGWDGFFNVNQTAISSGLRRCLLTDVQLMPDKAATKMAELIRRNPERSARQLKILLDSPKAPQFKPVIEKAILKAVRMLDGQSDGDVILEEAKKKLDDHKTTQKKNNRAYLTAIESKQAADEAVRSIVRSNVIGLGDSRVKRYMLNRRARKAANRLSNSEQSKTEVDSKQEQLQAEYNNLLGQCGDPKYRTSDGFLRLLDQTLGGGTEVQDIDSGMCPSSYDGISQVFSPRFVDLIREMMGVDSGQQRSLDAVKVVFRQYQEELGKTASLNLNEFLGTTNNKSMVGFVIKVEDRFFEVDSNSKSDDGQYRILELKGGSRLRICLSDKRTTLESPSQSSTNCSGPVSVEAPDSKELKGRMVHYLVNHFDSTMLKEFLTELDGSETKLDGNKSRDNVALRPLVFRALDARMTYDRMMILKRGMSVQVGTDKQTVEFNRVGKNKKKAMGHMVSEQLSSMARSCRNKSDLPKPVQAVLREVELIGKSFSEFVSLQSEKMGLEHMSLSRALSPEESERLADLAQTLTARRFQPLLQVSDPTLALLQVQLKLNTVIAQEGGEGAFKKAQRTHLQGIQSQLQSIYDKLTTREVSRVGSAVDVGIQQDIPTENQIFDLTLQHRKSFCSGPNKDDQRYRKFCVKTMDNGVKIYMADLLRLPRTMVSTSSASAHLSLLSSNNRERAYREFYADLSISDLKLARNRILQDKQWTHKSHAIRLLTTLILYKQNLLLTSAYQTESAWDSVSGSPQEKLERAFRAFHGRFLTVLGHDSLLDSGALQPVAQFSWEGISSANVSIALSHFRVFLEKELAPLMMPGADTFNPHQGLALLEKMFNTVQSRLQIHQSGTAHRAFKAIEGHVNTLLRVLVGKGDQQDGLMGLLGPKQSLDQLEIIDQERALPEMAQKTVTERGVLKNMLTGRNPQDGEMSDLSLGRVDQDSTTTHLHTISILTYTVLPHLMMKKTLSAIDLRYLDNTISYVKRVLDKGVDAAYIPYLTAFREALDQVNTGNRVANKRLQGRIGQLNTQLSDVIGAPDSDRVVEAAASSIQQARLRQLARRDLTALSVTKQQMAALRRTIALAQWQLKELSEDDTSRPELQSHVVVLTQLYNRLDAQFQSLPEGVTWTPGASVLLGFELKKGLRTESLLAIRESVGRILSEAGTNNEIIASKIRECQQLMGLVPPSSSPSAELEVLSESEICLGFDGDEEKEGKEYEEKASEGFTTSRGAYARFPGSAKVNVGNIQAEMMRDVGKALQKVQHFLHNGLDLVSKKKLDAAFKSEDVEDVVKSLSIFCRNSGLSAEQVIEMKAAVLSVVLPQYVDRLNSVERVRVISEIESQESWEEGADVNFQAAHDTFSRYVGTILMDSRENMTHVTASAEKALVIQARQMERRLKQAMGYLHRLVGRHGKSDEGKIDEKDDFNAFSRVALTLQDSVSVTDAVGEYIRSAQEISTSIETIEALSKRLRSLPSNATARVRACVQLMSLAGGFQDQKEYVTFKGQLLTIFKDSIQRWLIRQGVTGHMHSFTFVDEMVAKMSRYVTKADKEWQSVVDNIDRYKKDRQMDQGVALVKLYDAQFKPKVPELRQVGLLEVLKRKKDRNMTGFKLHIAGETFTIQSQQTNRRTVTFVLNKGGKVIIERDSQAVYFNDKPVEDPNQLKVSIPLTAKSASLLLQPSASMVMAQSVEIPSKEQLIGEIQHARISRDMGSSFGVPQEGSFEKIGRDLINQLNQPQDLEAFVSTNRSQLGELLKGLKIEQHQSGMFERYQPVISSIQVLLNPTRTGVMAALQQRWVSDVLDVVAQLDVNEIQTKGSQGADGKTSFVLEVFPKDDSDALVNQDLLLQLNQLLGEQLCQFNTDGQLVITLREGMTQPEFVDQVRMLKKWIARQMDAVLGTQNPVIREIRGNVNDTLSAGRVSRSVVDAALETSKRVASFSSRLSALEAFVQGVEGLGGDDEDEASESGSVSGDERELSEGMLFFDELTEIKKKVNLFRSQRTVSQEKMNELDRDLKTLEEQMAFIKGLQTQSPMQVVDALQAQLPDDGAPYSGQHIWQVHRILQWASKRFPGLKGSLTPHIAALKDAAVLGGKKSVNDSLKATVGAALDALGQKAVVDGILGRLGGDDVPCGRPLAERAIGVLISDKAAFVSQGGVAGTVEEILQDARVIPEENWKAALVELMVGHVNDMGAPKSDEYSLKKKAIEAYVDTLIIDNGGTQDFSKVKEQVNALLKRDQGAVQFDQVHTICSAGAGVVVEAGGAVAPTPQSIYEGYFNQQRLKDALVVQGGLVSDGHLLAAIKNMVVSTKKEHYTGSDYEKGVSQLALCRVKGAQLSLQCNVSDLRGFAKQLKQQFNLVVSIDDIFNTLVMAWSQDVKAGGIKRVLSIQGQYSNKDAFNQAIANGLYQVIGHQDVTSEDKITFWKAIYFQQAKPIRSRKDLNTFLSGLAVSEPLKRGLKRKVLSAVLSVPNERDGKPDADVVAGYAPTLSQDNAMCGLYSYYHALDGSACNRQQFSRIIDARLSELIRSGKTDKVDKILTQFFNGQDLDTDDLRLLFGDSASDHGAKPIQYVFEDDDCSGVGCHSDVYSALKNAIGIQETVNKTYVVRTRGTDGGGDLLRDSAPHFFVVKVNKDANGLRVDVLDSIYREGLEVKQARMAAILGQPVLL